MAKRAIDVEAGTPHPEPAPVPKKNHFVFKHGGGWAVKAARARKILSVHPTKAEAIEAAKPLAWPEAEIIVTVKSSHGPAHFPVAKKLTPEDELFLKMWKDVHEQYLRGEWPE